MGKCKLGMQLMKKLCTSFISRLSHLELLWDKEISNVNYRSLFDICKVIIMKSIQGDQEAPAYRHGDVTNLSYFRLAELCSVLVEVLVVLDTVQNLRRQLRSFVQLVAELRVQTNNGKLATTFDAMLYVVDVTTHFMHITHTYCSTVVRDAYLKDERQHQHKYCFHYLIHLNSCDVLSFTNRAVYTVGYYCAHASSLFSDVMR